MSTPDRSTTEEFGIATLLFTAISLVSWYAQKITLIRFWDSDEYYWMTYNLATHQPIRASAPWVFRILIPWLASFPGRCALTHGYSYTALALHYYAINIAATIATAWLLIVWLRTFVTSQPIRPIVVALFLLECSIAWS